MIALILAAGFSASATSQTLVQGAAGAVTAAEVEAAVQRAPKAARDALLSRPDSVRRQAEDLYVRRALAAQALRDGVDKDPAVATQLQLARERVLSDALLDRLEAAATPSDADVSRYARQVYVDNPERFKTPEQTRARHILVARGDAGHGRAKAQDLLAQLNSGASFERLAREHSSDPGSASKGGDLGWFAPGTMVKEFEQAVATLKNPGDISGVIETQFGYHIVRLEGRRPAGVRPFEDVRGDLERELRSQAQREVRQQKARELMSDLKVDADAIGALSHSHQQP